MLGLQNLDTVVTIGYNYLSKKIGRKGIINKENTVFTDEERSRLSVVAPNGVRNIIRNYEGVEKKKVETPDERRGIVKCNNPKCVTTNEPMDTIFTVTDKEAGTIRCHYCVTDQNISEVQLI